MGTTKIELDKILFCEDISIYENCEYNKYTIKHNRKSFVDCIKREQKFLYNLIIRDYKKSKINDNHIILVYIHADFGKRVRENYKLVELHSKDYYIFKGTDDYNSIGNLKEIINWYKKHNYGNLR